MKIEVEDDTRINIASPDGDAAQRAIAIIQELTYRVANVDAITTPGFRTSEPLDHAVL